MLFVIRYMYIYIYIYTYICCLCSDHEAVHCYAVDVGVRCPPGGGI